MPFVTTVAGLASGPRFRRAQNYSGAERRWMYGQRLSGEHESQRGAPSVSVHELPLALVQHCKRSSIVRSVGANSLGKGRTNQVLRYGLHQFAVGNDKIGVHKQHSDLIPSFGTKLSMISDCLNHGVHPSRL